MFVFGSGALAGLLSSLLAYIGRTALASSNLIVQDVLRVGAIIAAVGSGAAFLTGLNIMALMAPEASSTRPKSKPQDQTPAPTAPAHADLKPLATLSQVFSPDDVVTILTLMPVDWSRVRV